MDVTLSLFAVILSVAKNPGISLKENAGTLR
jgi:hypothetical protein